uniref:Uncharacterized protein n=1 Tax=Populus trichocarpa TaxID=3694 RepID=A0A3N7G503_POPTR
MTIILVACRTRPGIRIFDKSKPYIMFSGRSCVPAYMLELILVALNENQRQTKVTACVKKLGCLRLNLACHAWL